MERRLFLGSGLALGLTALSACERGDSGSPEPIAGATQLYVLGTIHGNHRTSEAYSLEVLREAIRRAAPDVLLAEIPPDRIAEAYRSFRETGEVTERRTRVFPEYVDVAFPLTKEMDFEIIGTAGWTREIADRRSAALDQIKSDPMRADQWEEHLAAQRSFAKEVEGKRDDPAFIHTSAYDRLAQASREPYQNHFDGDLGAGGWTQINAAHNALINAALDDISGKGLTAVITFGALHKYMILKGLQSRSDIQLRDPLRLFE